MTAPPDGEEEGLADGIVEMPAYQAARPPSREFAPWHRPRKQYVREKQWKDGIGRILDSAAEPEQTLTYLGLPGIDLLDLRFIHRELCGPRGLGLRFLGFNRSAVPGNDALTELLISLTEVRGLEGVDPRSEVLGDDLAHIGNESSLAWKRARELGPFDVVNWDLCDGFAALEPTGLDDDQYKAMNRLMALQARLKRPWLLFLTTRVDHPTVDPIVLQKVAAQYEQNLSVCPEFATRSKTEWQIVDSNGVSAACQEPNGLVQILVTGLCKWLSGIAIAQSPATDAFVESVLVYRVNPIGPCEDLVSIVIRFTPTFALTADAVGLSGPPEPGPDECRAAVRALLAVARRKNVDAMISEDEALASELVEATARLLDDARFDVGAYREWAARV